MDETYRNFVAAWGRLTWSQRVILFSMVVIRYGTLSERITAFWKILFTRR